MKNLKNFKHMIKFGIICGGFIISTILSCAINKPKEYVEFSTSACFKFCPILDAKYENKKVYFNFKDNNKLKGIFVYNLNEDEIEKIDSLIKKINLKKMKNEYISNREDVQVINVNIKTKFDQKTIYYYVGNEPKELQNLINSILKFKEKKLIKMDTIIKFNTRNKVRLIKKNVPPIPNFN